jgi:hypothetical protein
VLQRTLDPAAALRPQAVVRLKCRPVATGRVIGDRQIEVSFPDDATFTGVIDGQGSIRWSNGTAWQAAGFCGRWRHAGRPRLPAVVERDLLDTIAAPVPSDEPDRSNAPGRAAFRNTPRARTWRVRRLIGASSSDPLATPGPAR